MDVDALARLEAKRLDTFLEACKRERLQFSLEDARDAMRGAGHLRILDLESPYHVDVKVARDPSELSQVASGLQVEFKEGPLQVAGAEDTVAYKLLFGSPQDLANARSILVRQADRLKWSDLDALARRLKVRSRLVAALREVGLLGRLT